jgi:ubiquinone/menaquinone biosynthesis C-methylase UbiE
MISSKSAWWESDGGFFGDVYKEMDDSYEGHLNTPSTLADRTEAEMDGIIKLCQLKLGDSLMDCPSGYGRHSIGLAGRGVNVTGVDINDRFLEISKAALKQSNISNCKFVKGDMRSIDYKNKFEAVINMFYSFGFFDTDEENAGVAKQFYTALKNQGSFLMHTHVTIPRLVSGKLKNHQVRILRSGHKLELHRTYNENTKREDGKWILLDKDDKKVKELTPYSVRLYTPEEWEDMCRSAGFKKVVCYGDWQGSLYTDESAQLIAVATK